MDNRIVSVDIVDGELIVTYQDGSTESLGPVAELDPEELSTAVLKNAGDIVDLKRAVSALQTSVTALDTAVGAAETSIDSLEAEVGAIKNDLNQLESAYSAFVVETETGSIASFSDGADDVPVKDLTVAIEPVQSGSGDPAPDNVRPISGWTGAVVSVFDVNLWDEEWELGTYNVNTGAKEGSNVNIRCKNLIPVKPNTAYYLIAPEAHWLIEYDANKNAIKYEAVASRVYTVSGDTYYLAFYMNGTYGTTYNHDISINYPATDTAYHAYNGSSVSVNWTTEAGTVYGGTLDVTTGVLTVDRAYYTTTLSTKDLLAEGQYDQYVFYSRLTGGYPVSAIEADTSIRPICNIAPYLYSNSQASLHFYSSSDTFQVFVPSGTPETTVVEVMYFITQPQTYQLTPEEVKTILGQNNIFADCGSVTVQYRADTKLYIDKVLNA